MQDALNAFHAHKAAFVKLGVREHFNIPKIHSMLHYISSIRSLGSADGFNSESPERLHIDFAKSAYRASNRVDYYPQMTMWLQRQDAIDRHAAYLEWISLATQADESQDHPDEDDEDEDGNEDAEEIPNNHQTCNVKLSLFTPSGIKTGHGYCLPKTYSFLNLAVDRLQSAFGAVNFVPAFQAFLTEHLPNSRIPASPYDRFNVLKSFLIALPTVPHISNLKLIHKIRTRCTIPSKSARKADSPAHFDTVLVVHDKKLHQDKGGLNGMMQVT
jgi:hypothetical protein